MINNFTCAFGDTSEPESFIEQSPAQRWPNQYVLNMSSSSWGIPGRPVDEFIMKADGTYYKEKKVLPIDFCIANLNLDCLLDQALKNVISCIAANEIYKNKEELLEDEFGNKIKSIRKDFINYLKEKYE